MLIYIKSCFILSFMFFSATLLGQEKVTNLFSVNGTINTTAIENGKMYVGGNFTKVGRRTNGFASLNKNNGLLNIDTTFLTDLRISVIVSDSAGGYYVGGNFKQIKNEKISCLAHVDSSNNVTKAFTFNIEGEVTDLAMHGDSLYVVGAFDSIENQGAGKFFIVDLSLNKIINFNPLITGNVKRVLTKDNKLFLLGSISSYEDETAKSLVILDRMGLNQLYSPGFQDSLSDAIIDGDKLYFKTNYYKQYGYLNSGILVLDTASVHAPKFKAFLNGTIHYSCSTPDSGLIVFGYFKSTQSTSFSMRKFSKVGEEDTSLRIHFNSFPQNIFSNDSFCYTFIGSNKEWGDSIYTTTQLLKLKLADLSYTTMEVPKSWITGTIAVYKDDILFFRDTACYRYDLNTHKEKIFTPKGGKYNYKLDGKYLYTTSTDFSINTGKSGMAEFSTYGNMINYHPQLSILEVKNKTKTKDGVFYFGKGGIDFINTSGNRVDSLCFRTPFDDQYVNGIITKGDSLYIYGNFTGLRKLNSTSNYTKRHINILDLKSGNLGSLGLPSYPYLDIKDAQLIDDTLFTVGLMNISGPPYREFYKKFLISNLQTLAKDKRFDGEVNKIVPIDSFHYYIGKFDSANGNYHPGVCRFNTKTNRLDSWKIAGISGINATGISAKGNYIYITGVGIFNKYKAFFYRVDKNTGAIVKFNGILDSLDSKSYVPNHTDLKIIHDTIFLYGDIQILDNGKWHYNPLTFNLNTGEWYKKEYQLSGIIHEIDTAANKIIMLGKLYDFNKIDSSLVFKLNLETNQYEKNYAKLESFRTSILYPAGNIGISQKHVYIQLSPSTYTYQNGINRDVYQLNKQTGVATNFNIKKSIQLYNNKILPYKDGVVIQSGEQLNFINPNKDSCDVVYTEANTNLFPLRNGKLLIGGDCEFYNSNFNKSSYNLTSNSFEPGIYSNQWVKDSFNLSLIYKSQDSNFYFDNGRNIFKLNNYANTFTRLLGSSDTEFLTTFSNKIEMLKIDSILYIITYYTNNGVKYNTLSFNENSNKLNLGFNPSITGSRLFNYKNNIALLNTVGLANQLERRYGFSIDLETDTITEWDPNLNSPIFKLKAYKGNIFACGSFFSSVKSGKHSGMSAFNNTDGNATFKLDSNLSRDVKDFEILEDKLYLMTKTNSGSYAIIERYDLNTYQKENWTCNHNGRFDKHKLHVVDSSLLLTAPINLRSSFKTYKGIVKIDKTTGDISQFPIPLGTNQENDINSIINSNNYYYVSRDMKSNNGPDGNIFSVNKNNNILSPYSPQFENNLNATVNKKLGNLLFVTKAKGKINEVQTSDLAIIDAYDNITLPIKPVFNGNYSHLELDNQNIYIAREATNYESVPLVNGIYSDDIVRFHYGKSLTPDVFLDFYPKHCSNNGKVRMTIKGNGLTLNNKVYISNGNDTIYGKTSKTLDGDILYVDFNFHNDSLGGYKVFTEWPNKIETVLDSLILEVPNAINLKLEIIGYDSIRPNRKSKYKLVVHNESNQNLENIPVYISANKDADVYFYDQTIKSVSLSNINGEVSDENGYSFIVPNVSPYSSSEISFELNPNNSNDFNINYWYFNSLNDSNSCLRSTINHFANASLDSICNDTLLKSKLESFSNSNNTLFGTINPYIDMKQHIDDILVKCIGKSSSSSASIYNFFANIQKENWLDSSCISLTGETNTFYSPNYKKFPISIINSIDPNDKIGPKGVSGKNYFKEIPKEFYYTIRFENDSSATAPAQLVTVIDTLDKTVFDLKTIEFKSISVGGFDYNFKPNQNKINKFFDLKDKSKVILNLETSLDTSSGILICTFNSLDIETMTTEDLNPTYGFLPPNNLNNDGQGSISFKINIQDNLPIGTSIKNRADIIFDQNKNILTEIWEVNMDQNPPLSKVIPLPAIIGDTTFTLSWTGTDEAGIKEYDIYFSRDDINYKLLYENTSDTFKTFYGKYDSTYYFYSIAMDSLGNIEAPKDKYEAVIKIDKSFYDTYDTFTIISCEEYLTPSGKYTLVNTGIYFDTTLNSNNGFNYYTINYTNNSLSINILRSVDTLFAKGGRDESTFKWLDCNAGMNEINDAIDSFYLLENTGNFAVIINNQNCFDTSDCMAITSLYASINDFGQELLVFPIPSSGELNINLSNQYNNVQCTVYDLNGKIVLDQFYKSIISQKIRLKVKPGVYFLEIKDEDGNHARIKFILK